MVTTVIGGVTVGKKALTTPAVFSGKLLLLPLISAGLNL
jgi:hypothetical protein